jgi:hypothetical protein
MDHTARRGSVILSSQSIDSAQSVDNAQRRGFVLTAARIGASLLLLPAMGVVGGCESGPPKKPVQVPVVRDIPPLLRGTVGTEVAMNGIEPILVSGYGLVVNLNGTGGGVIPDRIAAHMEREMGLRGISKNEDYGRYAITGRSPRELLRDPAVAVVKVAAAIPPGSPDNATFDVFVQAINATSLEGGLLWTTDLQIGDALAFGGPQTQKLARARGPIFINPFAEPGSTDDGVTRTIGRVLDGGQVTTPFKIELLMDNPSPQRARAIVSAINSRFPQGPGDVDQTARGMDDSRIALQVPRRYRDEPAAFASLISNLQIDREFMENYAKMYADGIKNEPSLAYDLSWALEGVGGDPALRFARGLYDDADPVPRLAALKAGARMGDPRSAAALIELARSSRGAERLDAISLLGRVDGGPTIELALRDLMAEQDLVIRVAAYEAMLERTQRSQLNRLIGLERRRASATGELRSLTHLEALAEASIPGGGLPGIERRLIAGKFFLDIVPMGEPLIYITQQRQPRIVLFGRGVSLERPLVVSLWSRRFMLAADSPTEQIRLYYQDARTGSTTNVKVDADIPAFLETLARDSSEADPRPGLGMSYSEVVGVLYGLNMQGGIRGGFASERDKLRAELLDAATSGAKKLRPETDADREEILVFERPVITEGAKPAENVKPRIIPIQAGPRKE